VRIYLYAGQIASRTQSNDAVYSWTGVSANRSNSIDGLNRITSVSGNAYSYDANGNLTTGDPNYGDIITVTRITVTVHLRITVNYGERITVTANYGDSALNYCPRGSIGLSIGRGQTRTHRYSRHCPSCDPAVNPAASPARGSNTPGRLRFPASG
jgi:hypothetical protein